MQVNAWKGKNANFGEILSDLPEIWLIYMLIDKTIYAEVRVKQFMSDAMVGSEKEDRRSGEAELGSEVLQKGTK